jgi:hypothetical protein
MATNFLQTPEKIVLDLINAKNGTTFLLDATRFGEASAVTGQTRNTSIPVWFNGKTGATPDLVVKYDRADLASIVGTASREFYKGNLTQLSQLITQINTRYGLRLTVDDYVQATLPAPGQPFNLTAKPGSKVWRGVCALALQAPDVAPPSGPGV